MDDMAVRLEEGIHISDLRDNKEVVFQVAEDQHQMEDNEDDGSDFEPEDVLQNVYHEDDDAVTSDENDERTPFERMGTRMSDITGDGGVLKKVLKPGAGSLVVPGALVRVHYNGFLEYADEPFDSSRLRKNVKKFRLGEGEVLTGFEIGVKTMKKGELSRFLIKPEYAFGAMGCPPRIPADSSMMYEIEMLSFVEREGVEDFYSLTEEERRNLDFPMLKKISSSEKQEGNECYRNGDYRRALRKYRQAVKILENIRLKDAEEEKENNKYLVKLYLNLALCCERLGEVRRSIDFCCRAKRIAPRDVKVLYHYGKSLRMNGEFDRARISLRDAQRIQPNNPDITKEMRKLDRAVSNFHTIETEMCRRMFSQPTGRADDPAVAEAKSNAKRKEECTSEFQTSVFNKLVQFKESDALSLPFPSCQLSVPEISCIVETADALGLDPITRGTGSSAHLVVKKRGPSTS